MPGYSARKGRNMSQIQAAWSRVLTFTVKQYCFSQLKNKITWMCVCVCVFKSMFLCARRKHPIKWLLPVT